MKGMSTSKNVVGSNHGGCRTPLGASRESMEEAWSTAILESL